MRFHEAFAGCGPVVAALAIVLGGCQTAQTDSTPNTQDAGSTTFSRGTPDTTRSETTRVSGGGGVPAPDGGVALTLDRSNYSAGATVTMRITSQVGDTLGYNPCSSRTIERQEGSTWVAHPEPGRMCTMELRLLMPRQTQTATTDLPGDLRGGTYRIALLLGRQSSANPGSVRAVSPTFRVN